jgi:hypothetical protein
VICRARYVLRMEAVSRLILRQEEAVRGLIQILQMYSADTMFYIYAWCTGWVLLLLIAALLTLLQV